MKKEDLDKTLEKIDELCCDDSILATNADKKILKKVILNTKQFCRLLFESRYATIEIFKITITNYLTTTIDVFLNGNYIYIEIGKNDLGYFYNDEEDLNTGIKSDFTTIPKELINVFNKFSTQNKNNVTAK